MKRAYLFVEGPADADLLRRILPPERLQGVELVAAGGRAGVASLARSVLVERRKPIAVLLDADSNDPDSIEERRASTEELIRAAGSGVPIKVVVAVPESEVWFFAVPAVIGRVLGATVSRDVIEMGKRDPKATLKRLGDTHHVNVTSQRLASELSPADIEALRDLPEIRELTGFLASVTECERAA